MADQNEAIVPQGDWRPRVFVLGGLIGAALGLLSAYLFVRATEESGKETPGMPATGEAVRMGASLLGIIRTIAEWGTR